MQWFHVIWTTLLVRLPSDPRSDWSELSEIYSKLIDSYGPIAMSSPLDVRWQNKPNDAGAIVLSTDARRATAESIRELANDDRVAGETEIRALSVGEQSVQALIGCPMPLLQQRVGRLKSRTGSIGGDRTWSSGFWWARLTNDVMLTTIEKFVNAAQ